MSSLKNLRLVIHKVYEEVKVKIKTSYGVSKSFQSDIRVKQGCPFSIALFGFYIDKFEVWVNLQGVDAVHLRDFVI